MPQLTSSKRRSSTTAAALLLALLASVALAACGSSSKASSSTTATSASASTSTSATTPTPGTRPGALGGRFTAVRACLQKSGITLPKFTPGQRATPGQHGPILPKGVSKAQYEAALKKCGGHFFNSPSHFGGTAIRQALAKFATCMRENGVNVPKANTSGKGPIFNTKGLNTSSATFKAAEEKCRVALTGAFRGAPGAHAGPGTAPGASAPPTAG
jgi:hypothetical protein